LLVTRQTQYKEAAKNALAAGDKNKATKYVKISKVILAYGSINNS